MASDPKLVVALEARLNKFEQNMREAGVIADRGVKEIEQKFDNINPGFSLLKGAIAGVVGALTIDNLVNAIRNAVAELAKIGDVAERIGITTDELQALRYALSQGGGEASDADRALEKFAQTIGRASLQSGYLAKVFEANKVALRTSSGEFKSQSQLLQEFASLVLNATSFQEKMVLVTEAFGRSAGPRMIQTLEDIAKRGLPSVVQGAKEFGVVADRELVKRAQEFDDAWTGATMRSSIRIKSFFLSMMKDMQDFARSLETHIPKGPTLRDVGIGTGPTQAEAQAGGLNAAGRPVPGSDAARELERESRGRFPRGAPPQPTVLPPRVAAEGEAAADAFDREQQRIEKRIKVLEAEGREIGKTAFERSKARVEAELLVAAQKAELEITPELTAKIEALALRYAHAADEMQKATDRVKAFNEVSKEFGNAFAEAFKGMALEGKKLDEVLQNLLKRLAGRSIDRLFDLFFEAPTGGNRYSPAASLFNSFVGRAGGGGVDVGRVYTVGERGPELFAPRVPGMIIPNDIARGGGGSGLSVVYNVDATGADQAAIARLERALIANARQWQQQGQAMSSQARFGRTGVN